MRRGSSILPANNYYNFNYNFNAFNHILEPQLVTFDKKYEEKMRKKQEKFRGFERGTFDIGI